MQVLQFTLQVLTVVGAWRPATWTSLMKQAIYFTYTIFLSAIVILFDLSLIMYVIFDANNADEVTESLYQSLVGILGCFKIVLIRKNHQSFMVMLGNLSKKPFKPRELNESIIRQKFNNMIKNNTFRYVMLIMTTAVFIVTTSLLTDLKKKDLMFNAWYPFDYAASNIYYLIYIHQIFAMMFGSFFNIACDCLFSGLLLHISCQIEILEYRLSKVMNNQNKISECVIHHYYIFEFARMLNKKLTAVVGSQFIGSCSVVCCLLFRVIISTNSVAYIQNMMLLACPLLAFFYYCWFGNEVRLKSLELSENIYKMEWLNLNNNVKKCLLLIMNHAASSPIRFTSAHIVPLNLESFVALLKVSYSFCNLMRQT